MKHEAAAKRERTIALSHQPRGSRQKGRPSSPANCVRSHDPNGCNQDFIYLDGWMATKPWETRSMERNRTDSQLAKNCEELNLPGSKLSDASSVKVRRNNVITRVAAAKPPPPSVLATGELLVHPGAAGAAAIHGEGGADAGWGHGAREASAPEVAGQLF